MSLKQEIINALGSDITPADHLSIDRLVVYMEIFNQAAKDIKKEGYRRGTSVNYDPSIYIANQRYFMNIAFTAMNDAAKNIRAELEILGLSKKGKRIEVTTKIEDKLSVLDILNNIPDN